MAAAGRGAAARPRGRGWSAALPARGPYRCMYAGMCVCPGDAQPLSWPTCSVHSGRPPARPVSSTIPDSENPKFMDACAQEFRCEVARRPWRTPSSQTRYLQAPPSGRGREQGEGEG